MSSKSIITASECVGGQAVLARALGVSPSMVSQWRLGVRPIPADRCPAIERLTNGVVRCETLRPDVDWNYLRGTAPVGADTTPSATQERAEA